MSNQLNGNTKQSVELSAIRQKLSDCERNLIRKDVSLELVKESNDKLTIENRNIVREQGSSDNRIKQLTKELGQTTQKLHACINDDLS